MAEFAIIRSNMGTLLKIGRKHVTVQDGRHTFQVPIRKIEYVEVKR